mmetsp:Transcript_92485/g.247389  ORF Transcript_92485/g.247389 Transcript_92485/m.247389 type:complete len:143 (-) Transcript_92485:74-502(-)
MKALPDYQAKYGMADPIRSVNIGSTGAFAFVETVDENVVLTMLKFQNVAIGGQKLVFGRPAGAIGYAPNHRDPRPTDAAAPGMDVSVLQQAGILPEPVPSAGVATLPGAADPVLTAALGALASSELPGFGLDGAGQQPPPTM